MGTNFLIALGMELAAGVKLLAAATHEMYASTPEVLRQPMGSISYLNLTDAQARPKVHSARIKTEARSRFAYAMNTIHIVGGIKNHETIIDTQEHHKPMDCVGRPDQPDGWQLGF